MYSRVYLTDQLFCEKQIQMIKYGLNEKERTYIDALLIYTLWYEFSHDLDAQSDFGKIFVKKKLVPRNHSYLKYALAYLINLIFRDEKPGPAVVICVITLIIFFIASFIKIKTYKGPSNEDQKSFKFQIIFGLFTCLWFSIYLIQIVFDIETIKATVFLGMTISLMAVGIPAMIITKNPKILKKLWKKKSNQIYNVPI